MLRENKWQPERRKLLSELRRLLAIAARSKHHTNPQGLRVRTMHAAKYPKMEKDGQLVFETMWDDARTMNADHARVSFMQRWYQIGGECRSLKRDIDNWNQNSPNAIGHEVQLSFNFEFEMEESISNAVAVEVIQPSGTQNGSDVTKNPKPR